MIGEETVERQVVRVLLRGNQHLIDATLSRADGGSKLSSGVRELVAAHAGGVQLEVTTEPCRGVASYLQALRSGPEGGEGSTPTAAFTFEPDIVLMSLEPDLLAEPPTDADRFRADLHEVIRLVKQELGSHVIVLTASTIDPHETVSNYHGLDPEPASLRAHRLDLAVMKLSFEEGISLIDADRLLAELGAAEHVKGFLDYSPAACEALCAEFVRVIEDYGFLDHRPLIPQVGREEGRG
jgi:hypothetical protein